MLGKKGEHLVYSTLLGGAYWDWGICIDAPSADQVVVSGTTWSYDWPMTAGCFDPTFSGTPFFDLFEYDLFVVRLNLDRPHAGVVRR